MTLLSCTDLSNESTCVETRDLPTERASLVNVTLLSPAGAPVDGAIVTATATQGAIQPSSSRLTNSDGQTSFLLTAGTDSADKAGTFTVATAVEGENVSASQTYQFGASDLKISLTSDKASLPVGSVAVLTATVTLNDAPYTAPLTVTFNSSCADNNKATLDQSVTTQQGIATATYKGTTEAYACSGNDTITASVTGADQPAQVVIDNQAAAIRSITAATPSPEFIYIRGSGKGEKATITFTLKDEQDKPVSGKQLDFAFGALVSNGANYQDYSLSPSSATTNADGEATVTVNAGAIPVPLRVIATLHDDADIRAASSQIGVGIGYADDNSVSFSATTYNLDGWGMDGETSAITVRLADRFNNPVPDGTKVYFTTEGGSIAANLSSSDGDASGTCSTVAGVCNATLTTQQPRPKDGRVTVTAYVEGEESFWDFNGNGVFDKAELIGVADDETAEDVAHYNALYTDVGEVFHDLNVDDTGNSNPAADVDGYRVNVDTFVDLNANAKRDTGDGKYTGLICSQDTIDRGFCNRKLVNLFTNQEFVFTSISDIAVQVFDDFRYDEASASVVAGSNTWRSDIGIDLRAGAKYVRFLPFHRPTDGSANPVPATLGSNWGDLSEAYLRGINPPPANSTMSVSKDNGGDIKTIGLSDSNCSVDYNSPYPNETRPIFFCFLIKPEKTADTTRDGTLEVKVKTPKEGVTLTSRSIPVVD